MAARGDARQAAWAVPHPAAAQPGVGGSADHPGAAGMAGHPHRQAPLPRARLLLRSRQPRRRRHGHRRHHSPAGRGAQGLCRDGRRRPRLAVELAGGAAARKDRRHRREPDGGGADGAGTPGPGEPAPPRFLLLRPMAGRRQAARRHPRRDLPRPARQRPLPVDPARPGRGERASESGHARGHPGDHLVLPGMAPLLRGQRVHRLLLQDQRRDLPRAHPGLPRCRPRGPCRRVAALHHRDRHGSTHRARYRGDEPAVRPVAARLRLQR